MDTTIKVFTPKGEVKEIHPKDLPYMDPVILNPLTDEAQKELDNDEQYARLKEAIAQSWKNHRKAASELKKCDIESDNIKTRFRNNKNLEYYTSRFALDLEIAPTIFEPREKAKKIIYNITRRYSREACQKYQDNIEELAKQVEIIIGIKAYSLLVFRNTILLQIAPDTEELNNYAKVYNSLIMASIYKSYFSAANCKNKILRDTENLYVYVDFIKRKNPERWKKINTLIKDTVKQVLSIPPERKTLLRIYLKAFENLPKNDKQLAQEKQREKQAELFSVSGDTAMYRLTQVINNAPNIKALPQKYKKIDRHTEIVVDNPKEDDGLLYTEVRYIKKEEQEKERKGKVPAVSEIRITNGEALKKGGLATKVFVWAMMKVNLYFFDGQLINNEIKTTTEELALKLGYKNRNSLTHQIDNVLSFLQNLQVFTYDVKGGTKRNKSWLSIFRKIDHNADGTITFLIEDAFPLDIFSNKYAYIPYSALSLNGNSFNSVLLIALRIRQSLSTKIKECIEKKSRKPLDLSVNIGFTLIHSWLGLPAIENCTNINTQILKPIQKLIDDIRESPVGKDLSLTVAGYNEGAPALTNLENAYVVATPQSSYAKQLTEQATDFESTIKENVTKAKRKATREQNKKKQAWAESQAREQATLQEVQEQSNTAKERLLQAIQNNR